MSENIENIWIYWITWHRKILKHMDILNHRTPENIGNICIYWITWHWITLKTYEYRQTFNISCTLVGNKIVDRSDVVGASPVGAAPTTSSFLTLHLASMDRKKTTARQDEQHLSFAILFVFYKRFEGNILNHMTLDNVENIWIYCIIWNPSGDFKRDLINYYETAFYTNRFSGISGIMG